jgi:hypothetical protein
MFMPTCKVHLPFSTPNQCKVKWRNYRDSYLKHIKMKEQMENSGMIEEFRGYKYAYALEFLDGSVEKWKFSAKRPGPGARPDGGGSAAKKSRWVEIHAEYYFIYNK